MIIEPHFVIRLDNDFEFLLIKLFHFLFSCRERQQKLRCKASSSSFCGTTPYWALTSKLLSPEKYVFDGCFPVTHIKQFIDNFLYTFLSSSDLSCPGFLFPTIMLLKILAILCRSTLLTCLGII